MARPQVHMYVYYRIEAPDVHAQRRVAAMLAQIETRTGVVGRLLMRCEDPHTWMEAYAGITELAAFRSVLDECVQRHELAALAEHGVRHTECFTPVVSP